MLKRFRLIGLPFIFVVAFAGFGWTILVAAQKPLEPERYQTLLATTATNISAPAAERNTGDGLHVYAVYIVHSRPLDDPFVGFGIYLGQGLVLTAAHIVGRWPVFVSNPRVLIAGQDLPATVVKKGSTDLGDVDLALLSVDQERLPISLRLRLNPLCKLPITAGIDVAVVYPERTAYSRIISPLLVFPQYRRRFSTLLDQPEGSGSGVFHATRKCLFGIVSRKIAKISRHSDNEGESDAKAKDEFAGYFVPVFKIANFISR